MPTISELIASTEAEIERQRAYLDGLRAASAAAPSNGHIESRGHYSGPAEAIVAYLTQYGPTPRKVLLDALAGTFDSSSDNPQRSLTQAVTAGIKKGKLKVKRGKVGLT